MSDQLWLTEEQVERPRPHVPKERGKARSDDRTVLGGIVHGKRNGLGWRDAPAVYGPHKTLYNRFVRWSRRGDSTRIVGALARPGAEGDTLMMVQYPLQGPPQRGKPCKRACGRERSGAQRVG